MSVRDRLTAGAEAITDDPCGQLEALLTVLTSWFTRPEFRGCPLPGR